MLCKKMGAIRKMQVVRFQEIVCLAFFPHYLLKAYNIGFGAWVLAHKAHYVTGTDISYCSHSQASLLSSWFQLMPTWHWWCWPHSRNLPAFRHFWISLGASQPCSQSSWLLAWERTTNGIVKGFLQSIPWLEIPLCLPLVDEWKVTCLFPQFAWVSISVLTFYLPLWYTAR